MRSRHAVIDDRASGPIDLSDQIWVFFTERRPRRRSAAKSTWPAMACSMISTSPSPRIPTPGPGPIGRDRRRSLTSPWSSGARPRTPPERWRPSWSICMRIRPLEKHSGRSSRPAPGDTVTGVTCPTGLPRFRPADPAAPGRLLVAEPDPHPLAEEDVTHQNLVDRSHQTLERLGGALGRPADAQVGLAIDDLHQPFPEDRMIIDDQNSSFSFSACGLPAPGCHLSPPLVWRCNGKRAACRRRLSRRRGIRDARSSRRSCAPDVA